MIRKSVALILSLLMIIVLAALSASIFSTSMSDNSRTNRYVKSTQAFWLAEAGIQRAFWELNHGGGSWTGWGDVSGNKTLSLNLGVIGYYNVTVTDPTGNPVIAATGHESLYGIERKLEVAVDLQTDSPFTYAGFGKTSLSMSGNGETDSYDSSLGAYGGSNIGANGDVGTNGASSGAISLSGNSTVNGDAVTGAGGTVSIGNNASVTGTIDDTANEDFTSVSVPSSLTSLSSSGSLNLTNNQTLTSGDYKYSSISISSHGTLTLQGTVNIYLTDTTNALQITGHGELAIASGAEVTIYTAGNINLEGHSIVNNTNLPDNLLIYSTYSGSSDGIKIAGNSDFYGAIYAPDTEIKITSHSDVYGSIIGDTITVTGHGDIHYDESLQNAGATSTSYVSENWKEQENPYPL